ncbi:glycosyltransferase [bacterium]|nr:glycosyltransferase [bacterium]
MRILFIVPYVPSRIRIRPFALIRELSRNHEVHIIALAEPGSAKHPGVDELPGMVEELTIIPHSSIRGYAQSLLALASPTPMCAAYCWSASMKNAVEKALTSSHFDIIHVEHLRAAHFVPLNTKIPVVFDSVDCLTGLFRQMYSSKRNPLGKLVALEEYLKLRRYEPVLIRRFNHTIITSESEKKEMAALYPDGTVSVVPNGVDTDYFTPIGHNRHPHRMVFSGKMSYHPNAQAVIWFAESVFPAIKTKFTDAEFVIVGSNPPPAVQRLAQIQGITVTGRVEDIRPYLDSSSIAAAPMRVGVGVQNKVLEAMAMQLPVVASPIAVRPFGKNCPGIVAAETVSETAASIIQLMAHPEEAVDVGIRGRTHVVENYSWCCSERMLIEIYADLCDRANSGTGRNDG